MDATVDDKRREAARLALLAEQAALEAEELEREAQALRSERPDPPPAPPPPTSADDDVMALRAPLRWVGPYPAIALSFPSLMSPAQKARMLTSGEDAAAPTGVTLDFVLDTAANKNTINAQVAGPTSQGGLELQQVGRVDGGVGAGGAMSGGGATYLLGNVELADVPKPERVVFMSGLTASALPIAAPAAAGLLGLSFLNSFAGGVEFVWGGAPAPLQQEAGGGPAAAEGPTIALYGDEAGTAALRSGMSFVPVAALPGSGLPSVRVSINGVEMPALLDTGSPITALNAAAAELAGVVYDKRLAEPKEGGGNPFARFGAAIKAGRAAADGTVLVVGGAAGPVRLVRAERGARVSMLGGDVAQAGREEGEEALLGEECGVYVGDLPGLAALDGLGAAAGPAVVLGTDLLRKRPRMWYTESGVYV